MAKGRPVRSALRAARTNSDHELIVALRDRLAADVDRAAEIGDLKAAAFIAERLIKINDRLANQATTETKKEGSALDELAARRNRPAGT